MTDDEHLARLPEYAKRRFLFKREWRQKGHNVAWVNGRLLFESGKRVPGVPRIKKPKAIRVRRIWTRKNNRWVRRQVARITAPSSERRASRHFGFPDGLPGS